VKELKQQKLLIEKHFIIRRGGVECYKKNLDADTYEFIPFADFEERKKAGKYTVKYPVIFFIGMGLLLLGLVRAALLLDENIMKSIIAGGLITLLGIITLAIYRIIQIKYLFIQLEDDKRLHMLLNNPNQDDFEAFIDAMYEARKRNYRETYFYINEESDKRTEVSRMKWLLNENIITGEEYENIIDEINLRFM
jgi:hypothetical protein